jgi:hypothetical protein
VLFILLDLYATDRTPWTNDRAVVRPLPKYRTAQTHNNSHTHTHQISLPEVVFEPMIPVFERTKTVHALDRAATVIGVWTAINGDRRVQFFLKDPREYVSPTLSPEDGSRSSFGSVVLFRISDDGQGPKSQ